MRTKSEAPHIGFFNSSLLNDENYVNLIASSYQDWLTEFQEVNDKRLLWDLVKYRIFPTAKQRQKIEGIRSLILKKKLKKVRNFVLVILQSRIFWSLKNSDSAYDYITRGNIIRSKATWYEKGEKNNKYFLGLEKSRSNKNCIRKLINKQGQVVTNSKAIMAELKGFYHKIYMLMARRKNR